MKHLKKFNELNISTYRKASKKAKEIGHNKRAKAFDDMVAKKEEEKRKRDEEDSFANWQRNVNEYSKYGKFKFNIDKNLSYSGVGKRVTQRGADKLENILIEDFYLWIDFDELSFYDELDQYKNDGEFEGSFTTQVQFAIGIIPTTKEAIEKCKETLKANNLDNDFHNGFFWSNWITFGLTVDGDKITVAPMFIDNYDTSVTGYVSLADRRTAGLFRNLLIGIFNGSIKYPSGRTDISDMHDALEANVCNKSGLSSEYGLEMNHFVESLRKTSANSLFKES